MKYMNYSQYICVFCPSLIQQLALWFCDPQVAGSNIVRDSQDYVLFREMAKILNIVEFF